jgi:hypothetical protein
MSYRGRIVKLSYVGVSPDGLAIVSDLQVIHWEKRFVGPQKVVPVSKRFIQFILKQKLFSY